MSRDSPVPILQTQSVCPHHSTFCVFPERVNLINKILFSFYSASQIALGTWVVYDFLVPLGGKAAISKASPKGKVA